MKAKVILLTAFADIGFLEGSPTIFIWSFPKASVPLVDIM